MQRQRAGAGAVVVEMGESVDVIGGEVVESEHPVSGEARRSDGGSVGEREETAGDVKAQPGAAEEEKTAAVAHW